MSRCNRGDVCYGATRANPRSRERGEVRGIYEMARVRVGVVV